LETDPFALFAPARVDALLRRLSGLADLIVIEAPPVIEAAESQVICAAVDRTVLVLEEGTTRGSDGSRACELLAQVGASLLGAVLGRPVKKWEHAEPFSTLPVADSPTPASAPPANIGASLTPSEVRSSPTAHEHGASQDDQRSYTEPMAALDDTAEQAVIAEKALDQLAESAVAAPPLPASAPPVAVGASLAQSEVGSSSSAQDQRGGRGDESADTEPMAALQEGSGPSPDVEENLDQPAEPAMGDAGQPQPPLGASSAEYLLYSDTVQMRPAAGRKSGDSRDATLTEPNQAPAVRAAMPPPFSADLDASMTLTSVTSLAPDLPASVTSSDPASESVILATDCPDGHSNPPDATTCRVCGAVIPPQDPYLVSRPVLCVLRANDGTSAEVDRAVLVGRAPDPRRSSFEAPRLMSLHSSGHDISRTHVQIAPEGGQVVATDLNSTNGTVLVRPGARDRQELTPGEPVSVQPGSVLELGDGVSITVGLAS
jgi:hypothetical protein